ncbi:MAG: ChbG/HpnK family deacetylase, partial [Proteobacteria bacterium]|nr:ChbG/HpnK family deacetylase [Pseudomonadota bacterium]
KGFLKSIKLILRQLKERYQMSNIRRLVVNADDFGRNEADDLAIIDSHKNGIVTATSVFSTHGALSQSAKILSAVPLLRVGVHLDMTSGKPVSAITSSVVTMDGEFAVQRTSESRSLSKIYSVTPCDLEAEFTEQIELFKKSGLVLGHLDNHRSEIYFNHSLFAVCVRLAAKYGVPFRTPFDKAFLSKSSEYSRLYGYPEDQIIAIFERSLSLQSEYKIKSPDYFCKLTPDLYNPSNLVNWLGRLNPGTTELCTHPGVGTEQARAELAVLTAAQVKDEIKRLGIQLVRPGCDHH